jgi:molecular chaperone HtpG
MDDDLANASPKRPTSLPLADLRRPLKLIGIQVETANDIALCTEAELFAQKAEGLSGIGGFNLLSIKRTVSHLLGAIGCANIFDEYTKHDISHINEMLRLLEWIVPDKAKPAMSPTDWLHVVLGVYFHDLGMLVTEREYEARGKSGFALFKDKTLFAGPQSGDYRAKIAALGAERAERFFYQEFVRDCHAKRIRAWLNGTSSEQWGVTNVSEEVRSLLNPFGEQFRDDLGIICESHHLDDLDNLKKYSISRAYGRTTAEVANLQYSAILLRTADILHMTKDRTPSVMYRVTNPADPISQREWRKQMGVNRLCSQLGKDSDGNVAESVPRDTIEVHAFFTEAEPFFALSTFLNYVQAQLQQCHQWCEKSIAAGAKVSFPWKRIDREHIDAKGFLSKVFAFELDQPKILNLLTGHTLYNDSGVVLRELVQNSIDAVRLQRHNDTCQGLVDSTNAGVLVEWSDAERNIAVEDVGTGMTQEIVEAHLLRVGSSRYSTEKFKKDHPAFFPISRFGIGILTAFMIADEVDIFTCHPDEADARHILLRNLHGKYLIKTLLKNDKRIARIVPHGTRIELKLRPSAKLNTIESILRTWVVVPNCNVHLRVDNRQIVKIGHNSIREALEATLARAELPVSNEDPPRQGDVRVFSTKRGFAEVAFAARWSDTFKE